MSESVAAAAAAPALCREQSCVLETCHEQSAYCAAHNEWISAQERLSKAAFLWWIGCGIVGVLISLVSGSLVWALILPFVVAVAVLVVVYIRLERMFRRLPGSRRA